MVTLEDRKRFEAQVKPYTDKSKHLVIDIEKLKIDVMTLSVSNQSERVKLMLVLNRKLLSDACCQVAISLTSAEVMRNKSDSHLDVARKHCYSIVQNLEELVGRKIDSAPSEGSDTIGTINKFMTNIERFDFFQKLGFTIERLERLYASDSKWKWSFVDLMSRLIAAMKNTLDMNDLLRNLDPSLPYYHRHVELLELLTTKLDLCAERHRHKYEHNKSLDDMKKGLEFIAFHRRICNLIGQPEKSSLLKKKHQTWTKKLEEDLEQR